MYAFWRLQNGAKSIRNISIMLNICIACHAYPKVCLMLLT